MDVAESDVNERLELLTNARLVLEELERILDRHLEHVSDALAAEAHLEGLAIIALALAHLARHVHVGKEVHLDFHETITLACLATPALHVERESTRSVSADLRLGKLREQLADRA